MSVFGVLVQKMFIFAQTLKNRPPHKLWLRITFVYPDTAIHSTATCVIASAAVRQKIGEFKSD